MRRPPKRTSFLGLWPRAYRCRIERLESRSMMAADVAESALDLMPEETVATDATDPLVVDGWQVCAAAVCELQPYDFVDPTLAVDPVIIDDSCLMIDEPSLMVFEPVDVRVQFVSSETEPGWAAYYYTVGADGVVQGVSVVASYDEPTIAAFVAEHADDPTVQISDYGDGWWIGGFPLELAPPVPERMDSGGDDVTAYGYADGGSADGGSADGGSADGGSADGRDGGDVSGGWSWDESSGSYTWIDGFAGGFDWTSNWDESATAYSDDWSYSTSSFTDIRVQYVSSETEPGWATYYYTVGADGAVQDVSVWASYDEPTIAAFVSEHADDPAVQISDCGDGWWISGFPLDLAPPVPEQTVFSWGDPTALDGYADDGSVDPSGSLDVVSDWSWGDQIGTWYADGGYGGDGSATPLFYARGAGLSVPVAQDGFEAYSLLNDAGVAAAPVEEDGIAVPAAVSPRSAAFADMSMMAAAATAVPGHAAEAGAFGGRRRR